MRTKIKFLALFVSLSMLFSCGWLTNNMRVNNGIRAKRIYKKYLEELLIFNKYIYYHDQSLYGRRIDVDIYKGQDSILMQARQALLNTNLNLLISDSVENKASAEFAKSMGMSLRARRLKNKFILTFIPDSKTYIFPVINYGIMRDQHISGPIPILTDDYYGWSDYEVIIFIIKNKKVIYKRTVRYSELHTQTGPAITDYRSDVRLEHLGLIVEKAMEDYIKRIKKEE